MTDPMRGNNGPRYRHTADEGAPYDTISIDKLTPIIGAEIGGVDLSKPLGNRTLDEIHRALAENSVIFFRDQHLSEEQHLDFGRKFGELHIHPAAPSASGHKELMIIRADKDSPRANGEGWHSDVSCDQIPPMGSILYIRQCPPRGGDTLFASMYAAYEALSDRMKAYLAGLTAIHDGEENYRGTYAYAGVQDKQTYPRSPARRRYMSIAVSRGASSACRATRARRF
jgi:taurine dioxygenase